MAIMNMLLGTVAEGTAIAFDTAWMTSLIEIVKTSMGLLVEFPCNIFLAGGLASLGFAIFRKAKRSAK